MTSKKLLSVMLALVFSLSLFVALPVSAADGTLTATVGGSAISSGAAIPANSTIAFTVPYALTDSDVAENVVFEESDKATTVAWNVRTFSYTLVGDTLTVAFPTGTLAMNGSYRFTFKDPTATGSDVVFAFTTTAVEDYVMNDNFDRYPVGDVLVASATAYYPWFTRTANGGGTNQIVAVNGDKVLRVNNGTGAGTETVVSYRTAFSKVVTDANFKGVTEVEFTLASVKLCSYEIGGIVFVMQNDGSVNVYARHKNPAWNSSYAYDPANWTQLGSIANFDTTQKHTLKYITTHHTGSNDKRTLHSVEVDGNPMGADVLATYASGFIMGTGNHSVLHQGALLCNNGSFKNANSVTFNILNADTARHGEVPATMDIYSIKYTPYKAPAATLTASKTTGSTISQTETLTFTSNLPLALTDADLASVITLTEKVKVDGIVGTKTSLPRVLPAMNISADKKTITIAFPSGHLAPNTEYTITVADTIKTNEGGVVNGTGAFVYTTSADDGYYINDSFERYNVATYSGGYSQPHTPAEATMAPWAKFYGNSSTWVWRHKLVENNGDKALSLEIQTGYAGYGWLAYHNAYAAPAPENASMVSGTFEIDFDIKGTATTTFEINDIVLTHNAEGTAYNMYVRTQGALAGRGTHDQYVLLDSFAAPTGTAARYTLKYDVETNAKASNFREITKVSITPENGQEKVISLPNGRVAITLNGATGNMDGAINYDGAVTEYTKIFGIGDTTAATADALPTLNIYSVKYAPAVSVQVAEGNANGALDITINNKSAETINAVIALAVYNGEELVGVAGLADAATTVASGQSVTVTKTVANATVGNTYKVIFLNSKEDVKPLWFAASGTIE